MAPLSWKKQHAGAALVEQDTFGIAEFGIMSPGAD